MAILLKSTRKYVLIAMTERLKTRFLQQWIGANVFRNLQGVGF